METKHSNRKNVSRNYGYKAIVIVNEAHIMHRLLCCPVLYPQIDEYVAEPPVMVMKSSEHSPSSVGSAKSKAWKSSLIWQMLVPIG